MWLDCFMVIFVLYLIYSFSIAARLGQFPYYLETDVTTSRNY